MARLALNQPYREKIRGLGQVPGQTDIDEPQFFLPEPVTSSPVAQPGIFESITSGLKSIIAQVTSPENVKVLVNKTMYGTSVTPATTMYTIPPAAPSPLSNPLVLAGGGLLLLLMLKGKGKRR